MTKNDITWHSGITLRSDGSRICQSGADHAGERAERA